MQDLLLIEEVDVRRADDAEDTRVLTITKMALPKLELKTAEHTPGGGIGSVEFVLPMVNALQAAFSVKGLDLDTLSTVGLRPGTRDTWMFAATVRNVMTNQLLPLRAKIGGVIGEYSPNEHTPAELLDCDHALKEIKYYDLFLDLKEKWCWDWRNRVLRSGGYDRFAEYRAALGA